jgi:hypothetical protein
VSANVARPLEACWRAFIDATKMPNWVPGLRAAELVEFDPDGRPTEIRFVYAGGLSYSLRYTYDLESNIVSWEPCSDDRGGVRGFAQFEPDEDGTRVTYALEHDEGRKAAERALDDPRTLVEAFARWMHEDRDR